MKSKVVMGALALLFSAGVMAQDCTFFFPQTQGTQLVKKGYDAKGNLQSVMTYTVDEVEGTASGLEVEADYVFSDPSGAVYDRGDLEAFCQNGEFFIQMKELLSNPTFVTSVQSDLAATESLINYPNVSNAPSNSSSDAYFDDATIQIYSKKDRKDRKNVSIYDREYVKMEQITTPAGTFDCAKVKYKIKSRSPKETITGYGYEWYAPNVGVVKNEQYGNNDQLQYYTILEKIKK